MKSYAVENPVTAVFIFAVFVASALPISIFLGFAIATVLVSFLGFLFVEGKKKTMNLHALYGFTGVKWNTEVQ